MSQWIKVSDRLPPDGIPVLVFVDGLGMEIGRFEPGDKGWHGINFQVPTHWRHLPSPPLRESGTPWHGGAPEGPVMEDSHCTLYFRCGDILHNCKAGDYSWAHSGSAGDIVGYEVNEIVQIA